MDNSQSFRGCNFCKSGRRHILFGNRSATRLDCQSDCLWSGLPCNSNPYRILLYRQIRFSNFLHKPCNTAFCSLPPAASAFLSLPLLRSMPIRLLPCSDESLLCALAVFAASVLFWLAYSSWQRGHNPVTMVWTSGMWH